MYERRHGAKCPQSYMSTAEIAKLIRADIKAEIKAGNLPGTMRNYTVRTGRGSMVSSIDIGTKGLEGLVQDCPGYKLGTETTFADGGFAATACGWYEHDHGKTHPVLNAEGRRIQKILEDIHWSYNYDGSEIQVDYFDRGYYGSAKVDLGRGY